MAANIFNKTALIAPALALVAAVVSVSATPVYAQAQPPVVTGNQVCQTFNSNAMPYGYVGVANVDLGSVFSSIDTINGTISGTRPAGPVTITLPKAAPTGMWGNRGYFVPPWGPTGGWKSYSGYMGGKYPGQATLLMDVIDVRFGTNDGIHPGKAQVPQGVQGFYVVQRNEHGHAPLKLAIISFSLTVCGQPKQVALPDCGVGSTIGGQACYIYMIFRPGYYPGSPQNPTTDPQDAYSSSTLPSSYPNIVRCDRPAPLLNLTAPGNVQCMRKYSAVKLTPINGNLPVTNPSQGNEVFPPN